MRRRAPVCCRTSRAASWPCGMCQREQGGCQHGRGTCEAPRALPKGHPGGSLGAAAPELWHSLLLPHPSGAVLVPASPGVQAQPGGSRGPAARSRASHPLPSNGEIAAKMAVRERNTSLVIISNQKSPPLLQAPSFQPYSNKVTPF